MGQRECQTPKGPVLARALCPGDAPAAGTTGSAEPPEAPQRGLTVSTSLGADPFLFGVRDRLPGQVCKVS